MEKQTLTTYTAYKASIHFCTYDAEIVINDHASSEVVTIEGLDPVTLRGAISCYVHNLALIKDDETILPWFESLHEELGKLIKTLKGIEE